MRDGHDVVLHGHWSEDIYIDCSCGAGLDPELHWEHSLGSSVRLADVIAWADDHSYQPEAT